LAGVMHLRQGSYSQGKLENVRESVLSREVREMSGKNIIFEKSGKMILENADDR